MNDFQDALQMQQTDLTQSERLRMQRLRQGINSVQEQVAAGTLTEQEGQQLQQEIGQHLQPLQQRAAQAMALMKQQQQKMLQDQMAHMEAMQQQNSEFRAQGLEKRIAAITNPKTGEVAHMFEGKPNHWERVEWPTEEKAHDAGLEQWKAHHQQQHEHAIKDKDLAHQKEVEEMKLAHQKEIEAQKQSLEMEKMDKQLQNDKEIAAMQPKGASDAN